MELWHNSPTVNEQRKQAMNTINILPANSGQHRWSFCYLHGEAEGVLNNTDDAPDIFTADAPMPEQAGTYACLINNQPAVAVIAERYGMLNGRVSLVSDTKALTHALTPKDWR